MKFSITFFLLIILTTFSFADVFVVEKVMSGAVLKLTDNQEVRLIGIGVPKGRDQEAKAFMECLIPMGKEVFLEQDNQKEDEQGRILAYVFVRELLGCKDFSFYKVSMEGDAGSEWKVSLNDTLLLSGYAKPVMVPPNTQYAELFNRLHQTAFEKKRGLYKNWEDSIPNGTYYEYYLDGKIKIEAIYKDGELMESKAFDQFGNIIEKESQSDMWGKRDNIVVSAQHRRCERDEDCAFVDNDCKFKCSCSWSPVNREYKDQYEFTLLTCREENKIIQDDCMIHCEPISVCCLKGICTENCPPAF